MNDENNTAPTGNEENTDATPTTDAPATDGDNADAGTDSNDAPATDAPATDGDNADAGTEAPATEEAAPEAAPEAPATEEKSDSEENAA